MWNENLAIPQDNKPSLHSRSREADFGTLVVHRGEAITGIVYLRPGGHPPVEVTADVQALMDAETDWTPPVIAIYRILGRWTRGCEQSQQIRSIQTQPERYPHPLERAPAEAPLAHHRLLERDRTTGCDC
jgi:hypothetical protein